MRQPVVGGIDVSGADVVIPRGEGQRLGDRVVIEAVEESHEVAGHKLARIGMCANRRQSDSAGRTSRWRDEMFPVQHRGRDCDSPMGMGILAPVVVGLAPIGGCPVLVQAVERLVFGLQPFLEIAAASRRHTTSSA